MRVAEFLLLNPDFPHSVRFAVDRVNAALHVLGDLTERKAKLPRASPEGSAPNSASAQIEEIWPAARMPIWKMSAANALKFTRRSIRFISITR